MEKGNETKTVVPTLRFPEFRKLDRWEILPIEYLCQILNNQRKPIPEILRVKGPYPYYGASGIVDYINAYIFDEELLLIGEDGAKWGAYENTAYIANGKYWVNNHAHVLRPIRINIIVLKNYLIQLDLTQYITGAAPPKLTLGKLKEIGIPISKNPKEQQKIADCLSSLDDLIEATTQKVEALKEHKKGLMQRLFPVEGKNVPDLRFPEFQETSVWEEKKLGDIVEIKGRIGFRGYTTKDIVEQGDGAISLSPTNITDNGNLNFEKSTYISWEKYEESPEIQLKKGYIVLVKTGSSYGKSALVKELPIKTTVNPQIVVLKPKDGINEHFISALISHSMVQRQIKCAVVGGAIPTLSQESISKFDILYPKRTSHTPLEQVKIANCLSSLDELIEATSRKVEILKDHKKGLMQQLFPRI